MALTPAAKSGDLAARHDGIRKVWSPVNMAWFLMFGDSILRIVNTREEADSLLREWGVQ